MTDARTVIETHSGLMVDLAAPQVETIGLYDIAWHLGHIARFNGATLRPWSVAQHAVLVSYRLSALGHDHETQLIGLHHDDAEAYIGDVSTPLKSLLGGAYRTVEATLIPVIRAALGLPTPTPEQEQAVHEADQWALAAEAHHFLPSQASGWACDGLYTHRALVTSP